MIEERRFGKIGKSEETDLFVAGTDKDKRINKELLVEFQILATAKPATGSYGIKEWAERLEKEGKGL